MVVAKGFQPLWQFVRDLRKTDLKIVMRLNQSDQSIRSSYGGFIGARYNGARAQSEAIVEARDVPRGSAIHRTPMSEPGLRGQV